MTWRAWLERPVDAASLAAFRALFGALMLIAVVRFAVKGWIHDLLVAPGWHFTYEGFGWVRPLPEPWVEVHVAVLALAAAAVAVGFATRASALVLLVGFLWVELVDKTTYLNHYYLMSLLAALVVWLPVSATGSVDAALDGGRATVPAWTVYLLRLQLGVVYAFAGVAKLGPDWLAGQPLRGWLAARGDVPWLGGWLTWPPTGVAMAWAGTAFDLTIPALLCVPALRPWAFGVLIVFHAVTGALFPIGMFPWIMVASSLVFFEPGWPRRWLPARWLQGRGHRPAGGLPVAIVWAAAQVALPLRSHAQTADVLWTERGFRWSWRVLLVEKLGHVEFDVVDADTGRRERVRPEAWLTPYQAKVMATQPDMILQFAHRLRDASPGSRVSVYADSWVAFNGRPAARYVDPSVDLAAIDDGWGERWWVLPRPPGGTP
ncbi:MAG TPA: HTTM domain-containing protein [Myxococcota bacterium]|nr:HTTM domain-containing protein [Myxococcota bacterium]